jgi:hypothetical protein
MSDRTDAHLQILLSNLPATDIIDTRSSTLRSYLHELLQLRAFVRQLVEKEPEEVEERRIGEFDPQDTYGGNFDDAYDGGVRYGRDEALRDIAQDARKALADAGVPL